MTSPLTLDDVIIALVDNKVFLLVKPKPAFEQGSPSAKTTVTPPVKCMPASILNKPKPVAKAKASTKGKEPVAPEPVAVAPAREPVAPISEPVAVAAPMASTQVKEPELVPIASTQPLEPPKATITITSLKELKKEKVAAIRDLAIRLGISLTVTEDGKTKQKIKDVLIANIMAMV